MEAAESNPRPKARRRGTLHACPLLISRARREEAAKNRRTPDPEHLTVARRAAARPPACLMTFDPQPPGEVRANAHSLIRLRERIENPQLTDVPSDLRVNGARHASRDLAPPSKPNVAPSVEIGHQGTPSRRSGRPSAGRSPTHACSSSAQRDNWLSASPTIGRDSPSDDWTIPPIAPVWILARADR